MNTQWERVSRVAYCALEDNAFLLVLEGRYIHDDLHHSVLEPQGRPHAAFNHILAYGICFGAQNFSVVAELLVGTAYALPMCIRQRAQAVCLDLGFLAA